jgi:hypothetical protein
MIRRHQLEKEQGLVKDSAPVVARLLEPLIRRKIAYEVNYFGYELRPRDSQTLLDVGGPGLITSTMEESFRLQTVVINLDEWRLRKVALDHPIWDRVQADARLLPIRDKSVDFLLADNLIEHIPIESREKFARECIRVSKSGIFLTTPNYWFPFEPHYFLPFHQYLPYSLKRLLSKYFSIGWVKRGFYVQIDLLTKRELLCLFPTAQVKVWKWTGLIVTIRLDINTH